MFWKVYIKDTKRTFLCAVKNNFSEITEWVIICKTRERIDEQTCLLTQAWLNTIFPNLEIKVTSARHRKVDKYVNRKIVRMDYDDFCSKFQTVKWFKYSFGIKVYEYWKQTITPDKFVTSDLRELEETFYDARLNTPLY